MTMPTEKQKQRAIELLCVLRDSDFDPVEAADMLIDILCGGIYDVDKEARKQAQANDFNKNNPFKVS